MAQSIRCTPSKKMIGSSNMRSKAAGNGVAAWLWFLSRDEVGVGKDSEKG